jgi:hypothetical protein
MRKYTKKAIETTYKSITFRSRLEARWAIFFDTLGIRYEYEAKTYTVLDDVWYLPDFTLVEFPFVSIVEVKPSAPTKLEVAKCRSLSKQVGLVSIFAGVPSVDVGVTVFIRGRIRNVSDSSPAGFPPDKYKNLSKLAYITHKTDFTEAFRRAGEKKFA